MSQNDDTKNNHVALLYNSFSNQPGFVSHSSAVTFSHTILIASCVCVCHWLFCMHTHLHPVTFLFYGSSTRSHTLYVIGVDGMHCRPPLLSFWRPWSFAHCSWLLMFTSQLCTYDTWCSLVINSIPFHASPISKKKYVSWPFDLPSLQWGHVTKGSCRAPVHWVCCCRQGFSPELVRYSSQQALTSHFPHVSYSFVQIRRSALACLGSVLMLNSFLGDEVFKIGGRWSCHKVIVVGSKFSYLFSLMISQQGFSILQTSGAPCAWL